MSCDFYQVENDAFGSLILYGSLAFVKLAMLSIWKAYYKLKFSFSSPSEEALSSSDTFKRICGAQRNDLENVLPFVIMGLLYISSNPYPESAIWHFRVFLISRILHTIAYVFGLRQPLRATGYLGGHIVFYSMFCHTLAFFYDD